MIFELNFFSSIAVALLKFFVINQSKFIVEFIKSPDKNIFSNSQILTTRQLLMYKSNSCVYCIARCEICYRFPKYFNLSAVRLQNSTDYIAQRGFACAVFSNQCHNLTLAKIKTNT